MQIKTIKTCIQLFLKNKTFQRSKDVDLGRRIFCSFVDLHVLVLLPLITHIDNFDARLSVLMLKKMLLDSVESRQTIRVYIQQKHVHQSARVFQQNKRGHSTFQPSKQSRNRQHLLPKNFPSGPIRNLIRRDERKTRFQATLILFIPKIPHIVRDSSTYERRLFVRIHFGTAGWFRPAEIDSRKLLHAPYVRTCANMYLQDGYVLV